MAFLKSSLRPYFWIFLDGWIEANCLVRWEKFDVKIARLSLKLHQDTLVKIAFKEVNSFPLLLQVVLTGTPVFHFPVRDVDTLSCRDVDIAGF